MVLDQYKVEIVRRDLKEHRRVVLTRPNGERLNYTMVSPYSIENIYWLASQFSIELCFDDLERLINVCLRLYSEEETLTPRPVSSILEQC